MAYSCESCEDDRARAVELGQFYAGLGATIATFAPTRTSILQDPRFAATVWTPESGYRAPLVTQANLESIAKTEGIELGGPKTAATEYIVSKQVPTADGGFIAPSPAELPPPPPQTVNMTGEVPPPAVTTGGGGGGGGGIGPLYSTQIVPVAQQPESPSVDVHVAGEEAAVPGASGKGFGLVEAAIGVGLAAILGAALSKKGKRKR
jgi:hypothetical protein